MKWTEKLDNKLIQLIHSGKNHSEVAEVFGVTRKAIQNRCFRLKIQVITHKNIVCKQCSKIVRDIASSTREFCSNSCANTYSNIHRTHSQETKDKISKAINKFNSTKERIEKIKPEKIKYKRQCRLCKDFKVDKNHKTICEDCRYDYYKAYRPSCEFKFLLSDYPNEFNFELIKKHGWYSPSNKSNNLKGVSRDHLFSVKDGFLNKIDPYYISHPANCKLIIHTDNQKKNVKSEITLKELYDRIDSWKLKYY